jgi:hypothetical protein
MKRHPHPQLYGGYLFTLRAINAPEMEAHRALVFVAKACTTTSVSPLQYYATLHRAFVQKPGQEEWRTDGNAQSDNARTKTLVTQTLYQGYHIRM